MTLRKKITEHVWLTVSATLAIAFVTMILTYGVRALTVPFRVLDLVTQVESLQNKVDQIEILQDQVVQIEKKVQDLQRQQESTLFGLAGVSSCCEGDYELRASVNRLSLAAGFLEEDDTITITRYTPWDQWKIDEVKVKGSFRSENSAHLLNLSRFAGQVLHVEPSEEIYIRMEKTTLNKSRN